MLHKDRKLPRIIPGSAIFIDVPNIRAQYNENGEYTPRSVHWPALFNEIASGDLDETRLEFVRSYQNRNTSTSDISKESKEIQRCVIESNLGRSIFRSKVGKDIDSLIVNDIWMMVNEYQSRRATINRTTHYPLQIRHLLVTGDGGFIDTYRSLYQAFSEKIELQLYVYSWREKLNPEYLRFGINRIRFLDDISGFDLTPLKKTHCLV